MADEPRRPAVSTIDVAPLGNDDLPSVHTLIADVYREYGMTLNLQDPAEHHLADPGVYFRSHDGEYWVAKDSSGQIIATVAMMLTAPGVAELKSLYVRPSSRRRGLGRSLTTRVIEHARENGCSMLVLWSDTRFTGAHGLYEAMGFTRVGERRIEDSNESTEFGFALALNADDTRSVLLRGGD